MTTKSVLKEVVENYQLEDLEAQIENINRCRIYNGHFYFYMNSCYVNFEKQGKTLRLKSLARHKNKVRAIIGTWRKKLDLYKTKPTFFYEVEAHYKHFPISLSKKVEGAKTTLIVSNFYGAKKDILFQFYNLEKLDINKQEGLITIESKDDVKTGSEIANLIHIYKRTHQKKVDRRIFTDGFYLAKKGIR